MQVVQRNIVVGMIWSSDGRLLLGKKDPHGGGVYPDCWHLPGGGIEYGESHHEALRREIKEEVGIDIAPFHIDFVDGAGYGESVKTNEQTGESYLCQMHFYVYRIVLPVPAANVPISLQDDLKQVAWPTMQELSNYWLTPPSIILFTKLGYI